MHAIGEVGRTGNGGLQAFIGQVIGRDVEAQPGAGFEAYAGADRIAVAPAVDGEDRIGNAGRMVDFLGPEPVQPGTAAQIERT